MTREEAIQILNETFINTDGHIKPSNPGKRTALDIHQALMMAIEALSQPSLPTDLDEAADAHIRRVADAAGHPGWDWTTQDIAEAFIAGAQYAAPRWISVDEKLPEMDGEVIVLTDELDTAPIYKIAFGHIVDVERRIDYNGWNIPGVKYWMPCPEIPNND